MGKKLAREGWDGQGKRGQNDAQEKWVMFIVIWARANVLSSVVALQFLFLLLFWLLIESLFKLLFEALSVAVATAVAIAIAVAVAIAVVAVADSR